MWFRNPHFLPLIRQWWTSAPSVKGNHMFRFFKKMQYLKNKIRNWNKQVYKKNFEEKKIVFQKLLEINEEIIKSGLNSKLFSMQKEKQGEWMELCSREEEYWRKKS